MKSSTIVHLDRRLLIAMLCLVEECLCLLDAPCRVGVFGGRRDNDFTSQRSFLPRVER